MRVRIDLQFQIFFALIVSPDLREPEEEALLRSEPIDFFRRPAFFGQRLLQRHVSELHPADVGDVLALRQLAIDMEAGKRLVG